MSTRFRTPLRHDEIFRDENGVLDQIEENDLKSWDYLKKTPAYVAEADVRILTLSEIDKYTHQVFVDAYGELAAVVTFDELRHSVKFEWQQTTKSISPQETEHMYGHLKEQMLEKATMYYHNYVAAFRDTGIEPEFTAIGGRRVDTDAYEVTVASSNDIIAVVQFTRINQQGALFWQRTEIDSKGQDTAMRYNKKEKEVMEVARNYFYLQRVWPPKIYRRTPELKTKL